MGIQSEVMPFTQANLQDKSLILDMLKAEDKLFFSSHGQEHLQSHGSIYNTESGKVIQREILKQYGFSTDDDSLKTYRLIIQEYYRSPTDYDKEVLDSVVYLRENKLLYYTTPKILVGKEYKDAELKTLDNIDITLSQIVGTCLKPYLLCAAFSLS